MTNFLYNPDRKSKTQLIAEFVVRTNVFEEIMHDLETSPMEVPEQHYLLVGQRGSGKTTLLNRIKYAVEDSDNLSQWLIPVIFSEEQYNMSELANLWESIGQVLEDYHDFENIAVKIENEAEKIDFEERAYEILENELRNGGKKVLLLIDNIGDFLKKLDDKEIRRLREILQSRPFLRVIAGSPFYLESLLDYKQPFFEFFKVLRLDGLSQAETESLLRKLGEVYDAEEKINTIIEKAPERIETLRILTGGVPRTIALMFRIFIDNEHNTSINDLEKILDAVTPLYKHRMDDLPTQQQKIVDAVAKNWDPISVKDLKGRVRMESKIVSAQLRQLEKDQVIEKRESGNKNHYYLLKERFFNIWYLMRYGRKQDKRRALWLVRFLESWCTHTDIEQKLEAFVQEINNNKLSAERVEFFAHVYISVGNLTTRAKGFLIQADLSEVSGRIALRNDEIDNLVENAMLQQDYWNAIKVLCYAPRLAPHHKEKVFAIFLELFRSVDYKTVIQKMEHFIASNHKNEVVRIEIYAVYALMLSTVAIDLSPPNFLEDIISVFSQCLQLVVRHCTLTETTDHKPAFSVELRVLLISLARIHQMSLLPSVIDVFENIDPNDKVILEPLHFAILIITGKMDYSQIPDEKVELIRNIASVITKK